MRGNLAEIACKRVIPVNLPLIRPCGATFLQGGRLEACIKKPLTIMPAAFFINLSYHRLHLRCAACQLFRGDRLYLAGLVQLLAGHG